MSKMRFKLSVILVILFISSTLGQVVKRTHTNDSFKEPPEDKEKEYEEYCHKQRELRKDPESVASKFTYRIGVTYIS